MFCPKCRTEYRPGFTQCADCHVPLVPELPPSQHAYSGVCVFETADSFAIGLAKATMEDSQIPFFLEGDVTEARISLGPVQQPLCCVFVPEEFAEEARDLLAPLLHPDPDLH